MERIWNLPYLGLPYYIPDDQGYNYESAEMYQFTQFDWFRLRKAPVEYLGTIGLVVSYLATI